MLEEIKKIDISNINFSILDNLKIAKVSDNVIAGLKKYYNVPIEKIRNKVNELYQTIYFIKPLETKDIEVLYTNNYLEKGVPGPKNIKVFKQLWTQYRLVFNEKENKTMTKIKDSYVLINFDDIFTKLSKKIDGFDSYIQELKTMKNNLNVSNKKLENDKDNFELYIADEKKKIETAKKEFEMIKKAQEEKIEIAKKEIDNNFKKLQDLIDKFNEKVDNFEQQKGD